MSEIIYEQASDYIQSCTSLKAKIAAIDAIIEKLMIAAAQAAESGYIDEYWFDDGHIKIRNKFRDVAHVEKSIMAFQRLRNMYAQDNGGRMVQLRDKSNFLGRC